MNAAVQPITSRDQKAMQVIVVGKCVYTRKAGKSYAHLVVTPSKDEFSFPQTVEFFATKKLFDVDELVNQVCALTGRADKYNATDEDGQKRSIRTARLSLWAIE